MELRDVVAIIGVSYGIASDVIGGSSRLEANSVTGLVLNWLRRFRAVLSGNPAPTQLKKHQAKSSAECRYQGLMELAYDYRCHLLTEENVVSVDVALYGEHLVTTVRMTAEADA